MADDDAPQEPLSVEDLLDALGSMHGPEYEALANTITAWVESAARWRYLPRAKRFIKMRVLAGNLPITTDVSNVVRDLQNTSNFDTMNFPLGQATINPTNPRQVDITAGGGGADCMFDVIVSSCFTSLPGWVEGTAFKSLSGCTFYGTSIAQNASDYVRDLLARKGTIYICAGSYNGGLHCHDNSTYNIVGAGRDRVTIYGAQSAVQPNAYVVDAGAGTNIVTIRDLTIDGTQGTAPVTAAFGNQNGAVLRVYDTTVLPPASVDGCQFNGNETIDNLVITGPIGATKAQTGLTSSNDTLPLDCTNLRITNCVTGIRGTNAGPKRFVNVYIDGGSVASSHGVQFAAGPAYYRSTFENFTIINSIVGVDIGSGGSSCIFKAFQIQNCATGLRFSSSTGGISASIFDDWAFVLGTAGDLGVDFTNATNNHITSCQFTNLNFSGYVSGNEIVNASGTHIGAGTVGYHNVSDAGTVADFGNPLGHTGLGSGVKPPANTDAFVTIGNPADLPNSRAITAGSGITLTDGGAGSTETVAAKGFASVPVKIGTTNAAGASGNVPDAAHVHDGLGEPQGLTGATAATRYVGATASGAPVAGTFVVGDFVIDQTGKIYVCTVAGTPGTWVLIGPPPGGTSIAHELLWYAQTPVVGDNQPYILINFNGVGATGITPLKVRAKDYGYGTTQINLLRAPNSSVVAATGGLPNPVFVTVLASDLNVESSHITMTGMEDVTITGGALSATAFSVDDVLRVDFDAVNNMVDGTAQLAITVP